MLTEEDDNSDKLRSYMRDIGEDGFALCIWCNTKVNYSGKGWHMIKRHAYADCHKSAKTYVLMSSSLGGEYTTKDIDVNYGLVLDHPVAPRHPPSKPFVPMSDRKQNQQAYVLSFAAENSLSFSLVPKLIDFSRR